MKIRGKVIIIPTPLQCYILDVLLPSDEYDKIVAQLSEVTLVIEDARGEYSIIPKYMLKLTRIKGDQNEG